MQQEFKLKNDQVTKWISVTESSQLHEIVYALQISC